MDHMADSHKENILRTQNHYSILTKSAEMILYAGPFWPKGLW